LPQPYLAYIIGEKKIKLDQVGTSCAVRIYGQTSLKTSIKIPTRRRGLLPNMFWGLWGRERENLVH
jgi:hypothetical protein